AACSHDDVHGAGCILRLWYVIGNTGVRVERVLLDAPDDTDDSDPGSAGVADASHVQTLANGVLVGPELLGHEVVDDGDAGFTGEIIFTKEPAFAEGDFHGLEVVSAEDADVGVDEFFAGLGDAPFNGDGTPGEHLAEWQR